MTFEKEKGCLQRESFGDIRKHPNRERVEKSLILVARTARVAVCSMPCFPMGSPIFTGPQFLVKTSFNSNSEGSVQHDVCMSTVLLWEGFSRVLPFWPAEAKLE